MCGGKCVFSVAVGFMVEKHVQKSPLNKNNCGGIIWIMVDCLLLVLCCCMQAQFSL